MSRVLPFLAFMILLAIHGVLATNSTKESNGNGCTLVVPPAVLKQMEPNGDPLLFNVQFMNIRIRDVPNKGGSYGVEFRVLASWEDKRYIVGNEERLTDCKSEDVVWTEPNQFWIPNFFVEDALETGGYLDEQEKPATAGNRLLWYDVTNGLFYFAMFSYAKLYCLMDFTFYPFDTQKCEFVMLYSKNASYLEFVTDINYKSNSNVTELFDLRFEQLDKTSLTQSSWQEVYSLTGFTVFLTRVPKSHLMNTYLPTAILTIISFIGFMIPVDLVPGRMALLVTIFLMLVNISTMAIHRGPVTRDLTAMDFWFLICIIFVAMALFEYAILLAIKFGKQNKVNANRKGEKKDKMAEAKCCMIDRHALRVFAALYGAIVGIYFFVVYNYESQN